jgi:hypothetical protein
MKPRTTLILLVLAVVVFALGWIVQNHNASKESTSLRAGRLAFPDLAAKLDGAERIEITRQGGKVTLLRKGNQWLIVERSDYPALSGKTHALLAGLAALRLVEPRTTDSAFYDRLGVDDPNKPASGSTLLKVYDGGGKVLAELIVGNKHASPQPNLPDEIYVRKPDDQQSWLAEGKLDADTDSSNWMNHDIISIDHAKIAKIDVERGNEKLELVRNGDRFELKVPADHPSLDSNALDQVARALEFVSFTDVKPVKEEPGVPLASAVFTTDDGLVVTVKTNKAEKDALWVTFSVSGSGKAKEEADKLKHVLEGWAYQIGSWKERALAPTLSDLKSVSAPTASSAPPATSEAAPARKPAAEPASNGQSPGK